MSDVLAATEAAIEAATHLTGADDGAVEALRALARKIDAWDVIVEWALDDAADLDERPRVPQNDNVSLPTYLKFCDALGLTPAGRSKIAEKKREAAGGKLASLQDAARKKRSA